MLHWLRKQKDRYHNSRQQQKIDAKNLLKSRYHIFRSLLASNNRAVDSLTEIAILLRFQGDTASLARLIQALGNETAEMIGRLDNLTRGKYQGLWAVHSALTESIKTLLSQLQLPDQLPCLLPLDQIHSGVKAITGNKAASLAGLLQQGMRVPDGFAITLTACRQFLDHNGLALELVHLLAVNTGSESGRISPETARQVQQRIHQAEIPDDLSLKIITAGRDFFHRHKALAVRSSSISEDGSHHSFAGQFSTVLNVRNEGQLLAAFKEVVASNFNPRSLSYRVNAGMDPLRFDMAILCLEMVEARAAGILLSRSPQEAESGMLLISAVPGQGEAAVSGSAAADLYLVRPDGSVDWERSSLAEKEQMLVCQPEGGLAWQKVRLEDRQKPVLNEEELRLLANWGRDLERQEGVPVDLEWAVEAEGLPVILQMRPLTTLGVQDDGWLASATPLAQGIIASIGRATGRALLVKNRRDLEALPQEPVVLVMHQSFVDAVNCLGTVAAVLVELGSPADHLACVAREQGVPMICGLHQAGHLLTTGQWLTVAGSHGKVYAASDEEIAAAWQVWQQKSTLPQVTVTTLPPLQQEIREQVTALHLTDAYGPTFSIMECRSLHDIVRFVHEKGVLAMFEAGDEMLEGNLSAVHNIESPVPFFVSVIDMGGGLAVGNERQKRKIPPERVISRPFQALWQGITTPGLHWGPPPGGAPMGAVMSSFLTDQKSERPIGMPNYCLVSRDYCNMNARMDFHFIMIDAVCSPLPRNNHIRFRFKGGGTNLARRRRRALCIGEIFERYGFAVDVRDDLVNAALQGAVAEAIEEKLVMVGRILGFTRLLDAVMGDDGMIAKVADAFIEGDYCLAGLSSSDIQA